MVDNSEFKKYLENIFSETFINIEELDVPVEKSYYLGSGSSFKEFNSFYGDQEIFKTQTQKFVNVINQLFDNSYLIKFSELILYAGFERYETAVFQGTKKTFSMGRWRRPSQSDVIVDSLIKYRCINGIDFISRFLDSNLPLNKKVNFEGSIFKFSHANDNVLVKFYDLSENYNAYLTVKITTDYMDCGSYTSRAPDAEYYIFLDSLYEKILKTKNLDDIARLHFYLCRRVPHVRGGGAIAEWIAAALMIYSGYNFTAWSTNLFSEPWSLAITSGVERFIKIYPQIADL